MNNLLDMKYNRVVSIDAAPEDRICDDCRQEPAVYRCTPMGGPLHGETGLYCEPCAERYADHAERVSEEAKVRAERTSAHLYKMTAYRVQGKPLSEQGRWKAVRSPQRFMMPEEYEDEIETFPQ